MIELMPRLNLYVLMIAILFSSSFWAHKCWAQESKKRIGIDFLPEIIAMPGYKIGAGIFFLDQNPEKDIIIRSILSNYGLMEKVLVDPASDDKVHIFTTQDRLETPTIEFHKIDETKYILRVHKAHRSFPLVFSESFNQGWKVYLAPAMAKPLSLSDSQVQKLVSSYKILQSNERGQADHNELKEFLLNGLVTELGDGQIKTRKRSMAGEGHKRETMTETYTIDFISKNFHGTIQNNNLVTEKFWEAWFPGEITSQCSDELIVGGKCQVLDPAAWQVKRGRNVWADLIQWPDLLHWQVNGYGNSWWMDLNLMRQLLPVADDRNTGYYRVNPDESMEFELILEYWPQRLPWLGGGISAITFCFCLILLFFRWVNRKANVDKQT